MLVLLMLRYVYCHKFVARYVAHLILVESFGLIFVRVTFTFTKAIFDATSLLLFKYHFQAGNFFFFFFFFFLNYKL